MLKGIEIIKDRLQRKRKQYIHQGEKIEQMKCTMQNTGEEIEQLEYVLNEMEHIADVNRAPRVIPNARVLSVLPSRENLSHVTLKKVIPLLSVQSNREYSNTVFCRRSPNQSEGN